MNEVAKLMWRAALGVVVLLAVVVIRFRNGVDTGMHYAGLVVLVLALVAAVLVVLAIGSAVARFAAAPRAAKRNYPRMIWCRWRWRWLTRNLGLAYPDPHGKIKHRGAIGPAIGSHVRIERQKGRVRYPRARFRADAYGVRAYVKTTPRAGRAEFEAHSQHIADTWRCHRVQVSQPRPGRLVVRGLRTDPLAEPLAVTPQMGEVYADPFRPYLGRDEWSAHRWADLRGLTGVTIGGLPDYGKTSLVLELLCQLAGSSSVQFVLIDGKGGGDYQCWDDRAWLTCGDDLATAADTWARVEGLMNRRLAAVGTIPGPRNRWHVGPTPDYPLIVTVADECHTFFDLEAAKAYGKDAEQLARRCRTSGRELVKKGRSVLLLNVFITQKQTGDAIPTSIRDICGLGFSFACRTRDAAVAALGEQIRDYPSYCPSQLQAKPDYVGVTTATLPTGADPFVRLRVPEVTEAMANARAARTAHLRADPEQLLDKLLSDGPVLKAA
jgi:DNA segregation ATPase FtsK/SpoIIIE, S-DNA-T family